MKKLKLRGKDLIKIGFAQSPSVGMAIDLMHRHHKFMKKAEALDFLKEVLRSPESFTEDEKIGQLARNLLPEQEELSPEIPLASEGLPYAIYGAAYIQDSAREQLETAMRLPVTRAGALMPDAHHGYGLPIGGVLAVENAVIPYGVGMDIGCRMCLSVYDIDPQILVGQRGKLLKLLEENTRFGLDAFDQPMDDAVLARPEFKEIPTVKSLRQKARAQIGSSGSGNHFVEFGLVELTETDTRFGLPPGQYLGLLSHSGSRGMGANIAQYYTKVAMEQTPLPKEAKHLAWLNLDSEAGAEYWLAMNLAGDYASACHHHIHHRLSKALGEKALIRIENHHNFAWKETLPDGRECVVHRKGATPAGKGVLGIIPGSMTAPAYLVRGKGNTSSLQSAAHGAGRKMSRRKATQSFTRSALKEHLAQHQVSLIGGGLDEVPFAYKNIHQVMAEQEELVETLGKFYPRIVRMDS